MTPTEFEKAALPHIEAMIERAAQDIRDADKIIIYEEGGFGHQFVGPDVIRRFFNGEKCLCLFLEWPQRHNPYASLMWQGVRVIHIPLVPPAMLPTLAQPLALRMGDLVPWASRLCRLIQSRLESRFGKYGIANFGLHHYIACSRSVQHYRNGDPSKPSNWLLPYFQLIEQTRHPVRRLPEPIRAVIYDHLRTDWGVDAAAAARMCTLYLRQKGGGADSTSRSGSAAAEYLPMLSLLRDRDYPVFVVGDIPITAPGVTYVDAVAKRLAERGGSDMLLPLLRQADELQYATNWAYISGNQPFFLKKLLELFFYTERAIFIGEAGGGSMLAPFDGVPSLAINAFPYGWALPNMSHLYKVARDADGRIIPFQTVFTKMLWDHEVGGMTLHTNTAPEILEAAELFLDHLSSTSPIGLGRAQLRGLSEDSFMLYHNGTISPAFVHIYQRENASPFR